MLEREGLKDKEGDGERVFSRWEIFELSSIFYFSKTLFCCSNFLTFSRS